jgi:predicted enzyme related to lactoylglutathione lyase
MTTENRTPRPVRQLRLVVETEDYDAALTFYRDVLGLVEREVISSEGDARITVLEAGRATLELSNPAQVRMIDQVEAGGRPSAKIRVAFEVEDAETATRALVEAGGTLLAEPRETPWRSLNSRLSGPAGLQITLFQELDAPAEPAEDPRTGPDTAAPATDTP